jgi:hypothetical protein
MATARILDFLLEAKQRSDTPLMYVDEATGTYCRSPRSPQPEQQQQQQQHGLVPSTPLRMYGTVFWSAQFFGLVGVSVPAPRRAGPNS